MINGKDVLKYNFKILKKKKKTSHKKIYKKLEDKVNIFASFYFNPDV